MTNDEIDTALFYAFRYALGRKTYAVVDVCDLLIKYKDSLNPRTVELIVHEIYSADDSDRIGMNMDSWFKVVRSLERRDD